MSHTHTSTSDRLRIVLMACLRERDVGLASPTRDARAGIAALSAPLYVCVCVCVCVCFACFVYRCVCVCMYICMYELRERGVGLAPPTRDARARIAALSATLYVCICMYVCVCMCVLCMYACVCVLRMYVCMYVYVCRSMSALSEFCVL
jgi:hypothetical protein